MNIVCVICSELLLQTDEVFHTPCGHVFHSTCLGRWLEISKTCPQCRVTTTRKTIHRIYFNFSNDVSMLDSTFLQSKVDSLTFQLSQKDLNITELIKDKETLQDQANALKYEIKCIEEKIRSKISTIYAFKEQVEYYKRQCTDIEDTRRQLEQLKKDNEKLQNIQALIDVSTDVNEPMLAMCYEKDPTAIITYVAVMKNELKNNFSRRRELREKVTSLQQELMKIRFERQNLLQEKDKRKEFEEILTKQESERVILQTELHDIYIAAHNCICGAIPSKMQKCPKGCKQHSFKSESNETINGDMKNLDQTPKSKEDSCIIISDSMEDTPQNIKSQGFFSMKNQGVKRSSGIKVPSILTKRSKFNQLNPKIVGNDMSFDGFGGHAKYDKFPSPLKNSHIKKPKEEMKIKKLRLDTGDNQKLSDLLR